MASNHILEINCTLLRTLFSKYIIWGSSTLIFFFQKWQMKIIKQCKTLVLFQHNHSRSECLPLVKNVLFPTYSFPVFESGNLSRFQFGCGRCFPVLCSLMRFFDCGTQQTICHLAWLTSIWFVIHRICLSISFWYQRTHIRIYQNKITIYASKRHLQNEWKAMKKFLRRAIFQIIVYMGTASPETTHQKHQPSW